jgi:hypothetical protein
MAKENQNPDEEMQDEDTGETIGLKEQKEEQGESKDWDKVEAIVKAAQKACEDGTPFPEVLATLIETLTALQKETDQKLGGLGVGGPEMDLPEDNEDAGAPSEEEEG